MHITYLLYCDIHNAYVYYSIKYRVLFIFRILTFFTCVHFYLYYMNRSYLLSWGNGAFRFNNVAERLRKMSIRFSVVIHTYTVLSHSWD